jgi:hypothetical protein
LDKLFQNSGISEHGRDYITLMGSRLYYTSGNKDVDDDCFEPELNSAYAHLLKSKEMTKDEKNILKNFYDEGYFTFIQGIISYRLAARLENKMRDDSRYTIDPDAEFRAFIHDSLLLEAKDKPNEVQNLITKIARKYAEKPIEKYLALFGINCSLDKKDINHLLFKGFEEHKDDDYFIKLIKKGADINARNSDGETLMVLDFCSIMRCHELFIKLGAQDIPIRLLRSGKNNVRILTYENRCYVNSNTSKSYTVDKFESSELCIAKANEIVENYIKEGYVEHKLNIPGVPSTILFEIEEAQLLKHKSIYIKFEYVPSNHYEVMQEVFKIDSLEELTVYDLKIKNIPKEISNLKKLKKLCINCSEITSLPEEISQLSALSEIELWDCKKLMDLPSGIGLLTNLNTLNLENCSNLKSLPSTIGLLKNLKYLKVYGAGFEELPIEITELTNIKELHLCDSKLKNIPPGFISMKKLYQYLKNN